MPERDPSTARERSSDGDKLSYREAVNMFLTKEEGTLMNTLIASVSKRVDDLPTRKEHELRAEIETLRYNALDASITKIDGTLEDIRNDRLPKWTLPAAAVVAPIVFGSLLLVAQHFWK
jgi:hypothetical protein